MCVCERVRESFRPHLPGRHRITCFLYTLRSFGLTHTHTHTCKPTQKHTDVDWNINMQYKSAPRLSPLPHPPPLLYFSDLDFFTSHVEFVVLSKCPCVCEVDGVTTTTVTSHKRARARTHTRLCFNVINIHLTSSIYVFYMGCKHIFRPGNVKVTQNKKIHMCFCVCV